jgi:hypothetical protein
MASIEAMKPHLLTGEITMAAKTVEELTAKLSELEQKKAKAEQKHQIKLDKLNKSFEEQLKKCPYEEEGCFGVFVVDAEKVNADREHQIKWLNRDHEAAMRDLDKKIFNVQTKIQKLQGEQNKENIVINQKLVEEIKSIVHRWVFDEKEAIEKAIKEGKEYHRYYTDLTAQQLMDYVIMPIAKEITVRCAKTIGNIESFSKINFKWGKVFMTCWNADGISVDLWATFVHEHSRTSCKGVEFEVGNHVRVITH